MSVGKKGGSDGVGGEGIGLVYGGGGGEGSLFNCARSLKNLLHRLSMFLSVVVMIGDVLEHERSAKSVQLWDDGVLICCLKSKHVCVHPPRQYPLRVT